MAVGGHRGDEPCAGLFLNSAGVILGLGLPTVAAWADGSHFPSASSAFGFSAAPPWGSWWARLSSFH